MRIGKVTTEENTITTIQYKQIPPQSIIAITQGKTIPNGRQSSNASISKSRPAYGCFKYL